MSSAGKGGRGAGPWIGGLLRHAWQDVRERIYMSVISAGYTGLSRAHVAMFRFESLDGQRPTRVAEQMNVTKQSVNDLLRDLERLGYVTLRADPKDSRARLIRFTRRGRQLDAVVRAEASAAEGELAEILGARHFAALRAALVKLSSHSIAAGGPVDGDAAVRRGRSVRSNAERHLSSVSNQAETRAAKPSG